MMIFNVFGRLLGVKKVADRWQAFNVTLPERKYSPSHEVSIPNFIEEHEIATYLGDIFHESATEKYPEVLKVE